MTIQGAKAVPTPPLPQNTHPRGKGVGVKKKTQNFDSEGETTMKKLRNG